MLARALALLLGFAAPALAAEVNKDWPNYAEGDYTIADYKFVSGETLPQLKIHYITLGTGANWLRPTLADELFKPGQPLDAGEIFHHHARRARPRRLVKAVRRAQGPVPALPLS